MKALEKFTVAVLCLAFFQGCATSPNKISAQYVSPLLYQNYTDEQLIIEMDHVGRRTSELYASLKREADADKVQTGIGMILFWPALFMLEGGDGPEAQEYARLKGEYEALRQNSVSRGISADLIPPSPEEIIKKSEEEKKKAKDKRKL